MDVTNDAKINADVSEIRVNNYEIDTNGSKIPIVTEDQSVQISLDNSSTQSQIISNDPNTQITTEHIKRKLSYKWSPLKIAAVIVFILAILAAFIGLISYSQAGKSNDPYGAAWIWVLFILAILLFFLATVLLGFG